MIIEILQDIQGARGGWASLFFWWGGGKVSTFCGFHHRCSEVGGEDVFGRELTTMGRKLAFTECRPQVRHLAFVILFVMCGIVGKSCPTL